MSLEKVGDGYGSVGGEFERYHRGFVSQGKLWLFAKKYFEQPTHNWGHYVTFQGSYALSFCLEGKTWNRIDIPAVSNEENLAEELFVANDNIYMLLFTNFGAVEVKSLHKWNGESFVPVYIEAPQAVTGLEPTSRVEFFAAISANDGPEVYFVCNGEGIKVYKLTLNDDSACIEHLTDIDEETNGIRGQAVFAYTDGKEVAVGFGVHGCGFRWERSSFFAVDINTKAARCIEVPGDYDSAPKFCFSGTQALSVHPECGSWIHATGSNQVGMCDSKYDGSVWKLTNIFTSPEWVKIDGEIPEGGVIVPYKNEFYNVGQDEVTKFTV
ncbi:unnamed protein product [Caenorhabditis bovis]|uniref:Uncharacterized protein n=1 Tax=Caenorhabditis bovis TaxID=2654633 RepID=A0A8S1EHQ3_9PELO|nr:unnamed protein product [Caenorhabditis bovis]